jgi:hypothetical protein
MELQIGELPNDEFDGRVHDAAVDQMPADALTIPACQPDVKMQAIWAKRPGERDDLRRLIEQLDVFRIARRARHPETRPRKTADTRNYVAGAKSMFGYNTPDLLLEIHSGYKPERHYIHLTGKPVLRTPLLSPPLNTGTPPGRAGFG